MTKIINTSKKITDEKYKKKTEIKHSRKYEDAGIDIVDLDPSMILEIIKEGWKRIQGTWSDSKSDLDRFNRFIDILKIHPEYKKFHSYLHPKARLSSVWLRSMGEEFFE